MAERLLYKLQTTAAHKHILSFKHGVHLQDHRVHCIMEFAPNGDLLEYNYSGARQPEKVPIFFKQLASAVWHMHLHGIVHRDIKLENIMLQLVDGREQLKLGDFSFAKRVDKGVMIMEKKGSLQYAAPEVRSKYFQH